MSTESKTVPQDDEMSTDETYTDELDESYEDRAKPDPVNYPLFEIVFPDKRHLQQIMDIVGDLATEVKLSFANKGLLVRLMDPSHVCLVDLSIPPNSFNQFAVTREGDVSVRYDVFSKLLKTMPNDRSVAIRMTDADVNDTAVMTVSTGKSTAKIAVMVPDSEDTPLPNVDYEVVFSILRNHLVSALKQIHAVSDYVRIVTKTNKLVVFEGRDDAGEMSRQFDHGLEVQVEKNPSEDVSSVYSLEYLMGVLKHITADTIRISYARNNPLKMSMSAFEQRSSYLGIIPCGQLDYYLAPRVES